MLREKQKRLNEGKDGCGVWKAFLIRYTAVRVLLFTHTQQKRTHTYLVRNTPSPGIFEDRKEFHYKNKKHDLQQRVSLSASFCVAPAKQLNICMRDGGHRMICCINIAKKPANKYEDRQC